MVGFFALCSVGYATAPQWSPRSFYPWERLDIAWLVGASACAIMMVWLVPRYLLRLWASQGWGVWVRDGSLFLVSRSKPISLGEIYQVKLGITPFPTVVLTLNDGRKVVIPAWALEIKPSDLVLRIENLLSEQACDEPTPLS